MKRTVLICSALALWSTTSSASSSYPSAMKTWLTAASTPSCTACHASNAGGFGTVTQPFGRTMIDAGLGAGDVTGLNDALDAVEAAGSDSDSDGVSDIDEVRAGADPNDSSDAGAAAVDGSSDALRYGFGCGAGGMPVVFVLLMPAWRARRRRAASAPVTASRWRA